MYGLLAAITTTLRNEEGIANMRILVACEESRVVTIELHALGHEAYSCAIMPTSGDYPEAHLQQGVTSLLCEKWDMIIAFYLCTHLAASGAAWFIEKRKDERQQAAIEFFMIFANINCSYIAIENPFGIMSMQWRKQTQLCNLGSLDTISRNLLAYS